MIRFYSKIRHALWQENKFTRYLLYAVGEIALVVVGILIALQVNNWNEARQARAFERVMLQEIRENVRVNLERFRRLERRLQTSDAGIHLFLSELQQPVPDRTRLESHFMQANNAIVFTFNKGAYDSLKAGGLDRLSNRALRSELIDHFDSFLPRYDQFIQIEYMRVIQLRREGLFAFMEPAIVSSGKPLLRLEMRLRPTLDLSGSEVLQFMAAVSEANQGTAGRLRTIVAETEMLLAALDAEIDGTAVAESKTAPGARKPQPKRAQ